MRYGIEAFYNIVSSGGYTRQPKKNKTARIVRSVLRGSGSKDI